MMQFGPGTDRQGMKELRGTRRIGSLWWMRRRGYTLAEVERHYREWRLLERRAPEELRALQWERLKRLLERAYARVPYYRELMDRCRLPPERIRAPGDYARLPLLTKAILQEQGDRMLSSDPGPRPLIRGSSGGSTGQPTRVWLSPWTKAVEVANSWAFHAWTGWKPGERTLRLWGTLAPETLKRRLDRLAGRILTGEMTRNVHRMDATAMDRIAGLLERWRPGIVIGYTNAIHALALHLLARGGGWRGLRGVVTLAETLFPQQREAIVEAFGCPVFNRYASQEAGQLAAECERGRMHLNATDLLFEFVGPEGPARPGEPGSVVVTNLHNDAMPLLRYELGDVAVHDDAPCACGRGLPLLSDLKGRLSDLIVTPGGRYLFADDIAEIFYPLSEVRQFQVVQEEAGDLTVKLAVPGGLPEGLERRISDALARAVGADVRFRIETVEEIPRLPSGKHRICISRRALFPSKRPEEAEAAAAR